MPLPFRPPGRPRRRRPRGRRTGAAPAAAAETDRHLLYERAVQDAGSELALIDRVLRRGGRSPLRLREDFAGTALLAAAWVAAGPRRTAVAVDLDPGVLAWARAHRCPALGKAAGRLRLVRADVRRGPAGPFDAVIAFNFSWQVFKRRTELRAYLAAARRALAPGGALLLDLFGGWLAQQARRERRRIGGGVTYVWEHERFDAITHELRSAIHFVLPGGRRLRRAFRYDWRLWSIPEVSEVLAEAGFGEVEVLWDVKPRGDETLYLPRRRAENQPGWIAYLVARRPRGSARADSRGARP